MTNDEYTDDTISNTEYEFSSGDESINTTEKRIRKRGHGILRRYQRGIGLLDHPHFLLLYVPDDGTMMKLVKPFEDSYHRERIIQMVDDKNLLLPYYALSHLWGTSKANPHMWGEIGEYVLDEKGEPAAPVSMRPEKRQTLLALLEDHPDSYWWIDVLCARTDTPLGIMGDIYACCYSCYALVDCEVELITQINSMARELFLEHGFPPWERDVYKEVYDVLTTFYQCNWWTRVWTWQEAALPDEVLFIAEAHSEISDDNMLSIDDLQQLSDDAWFVGMDLVEFFDSDEEDDTDTELEVLGGSTTQEISWTRRFYRDHVTYCTFTLTASSLSSVFSALAQSPRQCMNPVDYVYGVLGIFQLDIPRKNDPNEVWQLFLSELRKSLMDPKRVTIEDEYDKKMIARISDNRLRKCNLLTAKNLGEVYRCFDDGDWWYVHFKKF